MSYNFSLLLLFLSGCGKRRKSQSLVASIASSVVVEQSSLITTSLYAHKIPQEQPTSVVESVSIKKERIYSPQELFQELEARSYDVYFPLGFNSERCQKYEQHIFIEGFVATSYQDIMRICGQEMERSGWTSVVSVSAVPSLMVFTKPGRSCTYTIAPRKASWFSRKISSLVTIWISYRS